jgi:hypothetical protein
MPKFKTYLYSVFIIYACNNIQSKTETILRMQTKITDFKAKINEEFSSYLTDKGGYYVKRSTGE